MAPKKKTEVIEESITTQETTKINECTCGWKDKDGNKRTYCTNCN